MTTATKLAGAGCDPKQQQQQQRRRICFSFAAYAKSVIEQLKSSGVPIAAGLTDAEISAVESTSGFQFPPDLRSILGEGLPVAAGFPNWRSSSPDHLHILLSNPVSSLLNVVSRSTVFWHRSLGPRPSIAAERLQKAKDLLEKAPVLVPIYRHFYVPASPVLNGNPVFYVYGGEVRCAALDLADFFWRTFKTVEVAPPAWAATAARSVDVWTELAEGGGGAGEDACWRDMRWRLREGGWEEEEVREMMGTSATEDDGDHGDRPDRMVIRDREGVAWHVRLLALALLRAGWSTEDVVYCMGSTTNPTTTAVAEEEEEVGPVGNGNENEMMISLDPAL